MELSRRGRRRYAVLPDAGGEKQETRERRSRKRTQTCPHKASARRGNDAPARAAHATPGTIACLPRTFRLQAVAPLRHSRSTVRRTWPRDRHRRMTRGAISAGTLRPRCSRDRPPDVAGSLAGGRGPCWVCCLANRLLLVQGSSLARWWGGLLKVAPRDLEGWATARKSPRDRPAGS